MAYVLTAACCLPLALGVAGATVAARFGFLAPYQPYLGGVALLLVVLAFYRAYRRPGRCAAGNCAPGSRSRIALWLLAAVVLILLTAPFWMPGRE